MTKLKKCPFCNSSVTMWSWSNEDGSWSGGNGYVIECNNEYCGCSYGNNMSLDVDEIAKLWNTRARRTKNE